MSLTQEELEFVRSVNEKLQAGQTVEQVANGLDLNPNTLRSRLDKYGYTIEVYRRLVPKRAPELDPTDR